MSEAECWAHLAHLGRAGWYWQVLYVPGEGYEVTLGRHDREAVTAVGRALPEAGVTFCGRGDHA